MKCPHCGGLLERGKCRECGAVFATRCPRCGNTLEFEEFSMGGEEGFRCVRCQNDLSFEMIALVP